MDVIQLAINHAHTVKMLKYEFKSTVFEVRKNRRLFFW